MSYKELIQQLANEGLRLANNDESGWTYAYINKDGERVTIWVTDEE